MRARWAILALALLALAPVAAGAQGVQWEQWKSVPGVFDVGGPRADGSVLVAGSAALYTLTPAGDLEPFARGPGGYRDDPGTEAYLAVSPGLRGPTAGCQFARDDAFLLRLHTPVGVTRVNASGDETGSFANVEMSSLSGIAFDTEGTFGHRLLVTGPFGGKYEVDAIDCSGTVQVITKTAPTMEGGMAVAPMTFGAFGGYLVAPDELTGIIWAIAPDGTARPVVDGVPTSLPKGGDVGVESIGFVPPGFTKGGELYYADRKSVNTPFLGTDNVLRMSSADLVLFGVRDGDLVVATEGGASMYDVRCAAACEVSTINAKTSAHGEGHLVFGLIRAASPSPHATVKTTPAASGGGSGGIPVAVVIVIAALAAIAGAGITVALTRRR